MPDFAQHLARSCRRRWRSRPALIVGGYHALPDEADPALLLERAGRSGLPHRLSARRGQGRSRWNFIACPMAKCWSPAPLAFMSRWRIGRA